MKKRLFLLPALLLTSMLVSCGGGGSPTPVGTSAVTVTTTMGGAGTVGIAAGMSNPLLPTPGSTLNRLVESVPALAAIPANVTDITITITAPDIATPIQRTVHVAGQGNVAQTINVPNGLNRKISVVATDQAGTPQYAGVSFVDLTGTPVIVTVAMQNVAPPQFAGLTSAVAASATQIQLSWNPASDNVTPASGITYLVYQSLTAGGENLNTPSFTTPPGATSFVVPGLQPATTYFFIVRARDQQGFIDANTVERSATTTTPAGAGSVIAIAGTPQSAVVLTNFSALQVRVTNALGQPQDNVPVTFVAPVTGASGLFANESNGVTVTTVNGVATATITANASTGSYTVTANVNALAPASFSLTNLPGPPASITPSGTPQSVATGSAFQPLTVTVRDAGGNPLPNVTVVFTAPATTDASGTFANGTTTTTASTNAGGVATATFTANQIGGSYTVTATIPGTNLSTTFSLTNVAPIG